MTINMANIDKGMDVFDSEGEKLGKIEGVIRDPRAESAMEQYRDAVSANVGTTSEDDRPDAGVGASSAGDSVGGSSGGNVPPFAGSAQQGGMSGAGAGATPGSPFYSGVGALDATDGSDTLGAASDQSTQGDSDTGGYLHIKEGGLLGIGGKDLFVPTTALQDFSPGDCVSLNITKAQAEERYANRPD